MVSEDPLDEVSIYEQQQASSLSYEDGYTGSGWVDAMRIEGFIEGMSLPGLDEIVISDYRGLLGQIRGLSPERTSREKITKAFCIMTEKGGDPEDCSKALNFADRRVRRNICSSSDALGRSSLISKNLLKQQSQFLNRIRLKADLSMVPA